MKYLITLMIAAMSLSACVTNPSPYYAPANFQKQDWAAQPFDQAKAACRYEALEHHWTGDTYDLEAPKYKACMEKSGYKFSNAAAR